MQKEGFLVYVPSRRGRIFRQWGPWEENQVTGAVRPGLASSVSSVSLLPCYHDISNFVQTFPHSVLSCYSFQVIGLTKHGGPLRLRDK